MHVSPTEPKLLRDIGITSSTPEKYGVDFLFASSVGLVGIQRKELKDLVASLRDGRLGREMSLMKHLDLAVLLIEGEPRWSEDGYLLNARSFTREQMNGVLFSVQMTGVWYLKSEGLSSTARLVKSLQGWLSKHRHGGFSQRPKPVSEWGTLTNRDWAVHLLQGFPGIGAETAGAIYDELGVCMGWTVTEKELMKVKGVGKVRARKMMEALNG